MEQRLSAAPGKVAADLPDVGLSAGLGCKADCIASGSAVAGTLTATIEFGAQSPDSFAGWIDATIRFDLAGETPVLVVSQNGEDIACPRLTSSGS